MKVNQVTLQKTIDYLHAFTEVPYPKNRIGERVGDDFVYDGEPTNAIVMMDMWASEANDPKNIKSAAQKIKWNLTHNVKYLPSGVKILNLSDDQVGDLLVANNEFANHNCWDPKNPKYVNFKRAIHQFEYLRDTEKVNWDPEVVKAHRLANNQPL